MNMVPFIDVMLVLLVIVLVSVGVQAGAPVVEAEGDEGVIVHYGLVEGDAGNFNVEVGIDGHRSRAVTSDVAGYLNLSGLPHGDVMGVVRSISEAGYKPVFIKSD